MLALFKLVEQFFMKPQHLKESLPNSRIKRGDDTRENTIRLLSLGSIK